MARKGRGKGKNKRRNTPKPSPAKKVFKARAKPSPKPSPGPTPQRKYNAPKPSPAPSPRPTPTPTPRPTPTPTKAKKQKALTKARKDGKVTAKEAKTLRNLGIKQKQITSTKKGNVKVTPAATRNAAPKPTTKPATKPQVGSVNQSRGGSSNPSYAGVGNNDPGGNRFLSGGQANQLTKILNNPAKFGFTKPDQTTTTYDDDGEEITTTTPGGIDYEKLADQRLVGKAIRGLSKQGKNINNFDSSGDLQKLLNYAQPLATKKDDGSLSDYGPRASGKISDIREALGVDRKTALEIRDSFINKKITTEDPRYSKILKDLKAGLNGKKGGRFQVPQLGKTFTGVDEGDLNIVNTNKYKRDLQNQRDAKKQYNQIQQAIQPIQSLVEKINAPLETIRVSDYIDQFNLDGPTERPDINTELNENIDRYGTKTAEVNQNYQDIIDSLSLQNEELGSLNDNFAATNQYLTDEIASANAAVEEANRRANNMRTAFTPGANPNAMSILAGDYRRSRRRREDNQLSDLNILSDLGTNKNPLSGLQLA